MDTKNLTPTLSAEEGIARGVRNPPVLLWAAVCGAVAIGLLLILGAVIDTRGGFSFDPRITLALRVPGDTAQPIGPSWLRDAMIDITATGGATVLTLVVIGTVALLASRRLWLTAALTAAATITGSWAVTQMKLHVGRPRPEIVDHLVQVTGNSFPSGHAANSAIVYLTIAALGTQVTKGAATRNTLLAGAILLVGAIGVSRVYLGVHWPSDVLAGWSFGTLWAAMWWFLGAKLRHRVPQAAAPTPVHP
ncbi:phosphatase PAP2 family protein [Sphingomonas floccifaciens]|uniref:Phosphatase PAP2 family protein n=1 Tax=Sphingomonas floccifaciens TaxID=1844115 RepID=A0ABW4NHW5_9SPHN